MTVGLAAASHVQTSLQKLLATNARNIALAEEKGLNLLTVCNTCTLMLREAKTNLITTKTKEQKLTKLAQIGKQYHRCTTDNTRLLWVLIYVGLDKLES